MSEFRAEHAVVIGPTEAPTKADAGERAGARGRGRRHCRAARRGGP